MHHIFVDESIHERGDFIVVAAVVTEADIDSDIAKLLRECGFDPGVNEFKSSLRMLGNQAAEQLRDGIKGLLFERCKVGLAVCSLTERDEIMEIAARLISKFSASLGLGSKVYFDQGIRSTALNLPESYSIEKKCDSRVVLGIQLADCAAHMIATLLLGELGLVTKSVPTRNGYPEPEVELTWELWSDLRYCLASERPIGGYDREGWCEPMMHPFGLVISDGCNSALREVIEMRLGGIWLGCIL